MSTLFINVPGQRLFRGIVLLFSFVLGCQATWILAAELPRPSSFGFPRSAQAAAAAFTNRNAAARAASFGLFRGDLLAEYAITYLNLIWRDGPNTESAQASKTVLQAREVVDHALAFSPHDARIWLVLAGIDTRFNSLNQKPTTALQMAYYTGTNEAELIPLRLILAVNSDALDNEDFQQLVRHDISIIVTRKPKLEPAILAAYRDAPPLGRQFLEDTLRQIDPTMLEKLRK